MKNRVIRAVIVIVFAIFLCLVSIFNIKSESSNQDIKKVDGNELGEVSGTVPENETEIDEQKREFKKALDASKGNVTITVSKAKMIPVETGKEGTEDGERYFVEIRYSYLDENNISEGENILSLVYDKVKRCYSKENYEYEKGQLDDIKDLYIFDDKDYIITGNADWILSDVSTDEDESFDRDEIANFAVQAIEKSENELENTKEENTDLTALFDADFTLAFDNAKQNIHISDVKGDYIYSSENTAELYSEKLYKVTLTGFIGGDVNEK